MKNRSRPFECPIAGKTVGISLRHGGVVGEPDDVYVRCDERDCQYVDLNQPPCPLRVEMFADGSEHRVAEYLAANPGIRVCYACMTEELGITHDQVRRASWLFKGAEGFSIRPSRCAACRRRHVTIGLAGGGAATIAAEAPQPHPTVVDLAVGTVAPYLRAHPGYSFCVHCLARDLRMPTGLVREAKWALEPSEPFQIRTGQCVSCLMSKRVIRYENPSGDEEAPRRVIEFLTKSPGQAFCPSCVAFATDIALAHVKRILVNLEPIAEFARREAACSVCGRWQSVIGPGGGDVAESSRVGDLDDAPFGGVRYRGFRIDLLSFRTAEGWRSFALVKGRNSAPIPDGTVFVFGLKPTKVEADQVAATEARGWIDKHYP